MNMEHDTKAPDSPAVAGLVERTVGRLEPERADGSEHYWDDRDELFDDEPVCPCCGGDGMDPMTDYALPCPECGYGE
jgi:hypothetical protein